MTTIPDDAIVVVGSRKDGCVAVLEKPGGHKIAQVTRMTIQEYLATPETKQPRELAFGALRVADSPRPNHQRAVLQLALALNEHVRSRLLGEVWVSPLDVILDADAALVVQPDLFFVAEERAGIVSDRVRGAPDLVVEVLSPDPRIGATNERLTWFARYGVRECWIVHLIDRWIEVVTFGNGEIQRRSRFAGGVRVSSDVLAEFDKSFDSMLGW